MNLRIGVSSRVSDRTNRVTDEFILLNTTSGKAQYVTHVWGRGSERITARDVDGTAYQNHKLPMKFRAITGLG